MMNRQEHILRYLQSDKTSLVYDMLNGFLSQKIILGENEKEINFAMVLWTILLIIYLTYLR